VERVLRKNKVLVLALSALLVISIFLFYTIPNGVVPSGITGILAQKSYPPIISEVPPVMVWCIESPSGLQIIGGKTWYLTENHMLLTSLAEFGQFQVGDTVNASGYSTEVVGVDGLTYSLLEVGEITFWYNITPPMYNLTISVSPLGSGFTSPAVGTYSYEEGTSVEVTATPLGDYLFGNWSLDGIVYSSNPLTVFMDSNHQLQAVFEEEEPPPPPVEYTLDISAGTIGGITNPALGTHTYEENSVVSVSALAQQGYKFDYWSLDDVWSTQNPIDVIMTTNRTLIVYFEELSSYSLQISVATIGGTTNPSPGTYEYIEGIEVSVLAVPDQNYDFDYWTLDGLASYYNPAQVLIDQNHDLVVYFEEHSAPPQGIFSDNFESADFSKWTGTKTSQGQSMEVVLDGLPPYEGNYHAKFVVDGGLLATSAYCYYDFAPSYTQINLRAYIYISEFDNPTQPHEYYFVTIATDSGGILCQLGVTGEDAELVFICFTSAGVIMRYGFDEILTSNVWHCLEIQMTQSSNGGYRVWIDGQAIERFSIDGDTSTYAPTRVYVGNYHGCAYHAPDKITFYMDEVIVADEYIGV